MNIGTSFPPSPIFIDSMHNEAFASQAHDDLRQTSLASPESENGKFVWRNNFDTKHISFYEECIEVYKKHGVTAKIGSPVKHLDFGFWVEEKGQNTYPIWQECMNLPSFPFRSV